MFGIYYILHFFISNDLSNDRSFRAMELVRPDHTRYRTRGATSDRRLVGAWTAAVLCRLQLSNGDV